MLLTANLLSDIEAVDKEIEAGTSAIISCVINGISQQLDNVQWTQGGAPISNSADYTIVPGTFNGNTFSQITTLSIGATENTEDMIYKCLITSNEWEITDQETSVSLDVFCKYYWYLVSSLFVNIFNIG